MADAETETLIEEISKQDSISSDSSDSEDDVLDEDVHLHTLQKALTDNPCDYDAHLKYISCLRKLGRIDQLRQAREAMSDLFPLTPAMWQEWAKDEASLSSSNDAIVNLYERGLHDYLSVSLWCDYIDFVQTNDPLVRDYSSVGISTIRNLFERAVTAVGLHVTEGSRIWNTYIKFEQTVHDIDDGPIEEKEKQVQRIRNIFHRQLSVPLYDYKSTFLAYKSWEIEQKGVPKVTSNDFDGIPSHVSTAYEKAMEMYNARAPYEEQISKQGAPEEKLQHFMAYLKFEQSFGDPARVQILYERAVTEFSVSSELWLDYVRYLDETLKVGKGILDVYSRATRNCTWIGELWVRYLLALERAHSSEEKLSNVFEKSLQCAFSSSEEYLDIFLTRIDGLRRKVCTAASSVDSSDYSVVRDTFQRATDWLSPYLKNTNVLLRLHAYWARLELNHGKDIVAVRGVWESLLKTSGSMLEAWNQYIAMEIQMGHIDEARRVYKRCYTKRFTGTGSEDICHSWVRFEREFGTLEYYDHAVRKVTPRLEELQLFHLQQQSKTDVTSVAQKNDVVSKKTPQKRKMSARSTDEQPTLKKQRSVAQEPMKSFGTEASQTRDENNVGSGNPQVDKSDAMNEGVKHSASKEGYKDQCTAFLSNLSFQAKDETLREFFSDIGGVTAIRLLKDKFTGKSRGLAYVDFEDDVHLAAALKKNKKILMGKKVSVAKSAPKNKRKESSHSGKINRENDKRGPATDGGGSGEGLVSQEKGSAASNASSSTSKRHEKGVQLKGKNTFAVPRSVARPLGWSKNEEKKERDKEDTLKSNDEFREQMLKK